MPTKNTTIRLDKEMIKEVDERCKEQTCTRNDYIKKAIDNQLELDVSIENEENTPGPDHNPAPKERKPEPKPKVEEIPEPKVIEVDLTPNELLNARFVKPSSNSKKPRIDMVLFNGKYIPKAEVYEI